MIAGIIKAPQIVAGTMLPGLFIVLARIGVCMLDLDHIISSRNVRKQRNDYKGGADDV